MKEKRIKHLLFLISALIIIIAIFIFRNSLSDSSESHRASNTVLRWLFGDRFEENKTASFLIRRVAHLIEYSVLGAAVMTLMLYLKKNIKKTFFGFAFFGTLAIAVFDEYIQSLSDRTSLVSDIFLDYAGVLFGFAAVFLADKIICRLRKRKADRKAKTL